MTSFQRQKKRNNPDTAFDQTKIKKEQTQRISLIISIWDSFRPMHNWKYNVINEEENQSTQLLIKS